MPGYFLHVMYPRIVPSTKRVMNAILKTDTAVIMRRYVFFENIKSGIQEYSET